MDRRVIVRPPRAAEAAALRDLAERTFVATFADHNAPADLEAYVRTAFSPERFTAELEDEASRFVVATLADTEERLMGYGKLRRDSQEPCVRGEAPVELERIYVDPEAIGKGVGAALMASLLGEASRLGHRTVWLGVWERNERAIAFYRRWGFEVVGTHVFRLGSDDQTDWVMERSLDGRGGS